MDDKIPTEGGVVATRTIKSHPVYKNIPVVYFTGNRDIDALAENAGADYTLAKPFSITDLENIVERALKASRAN